MVLNEAQRALQNKRRNEVMSLAMRGKTQEEIADKLGIGVMTVVRDLNASRNEIMRNVKNIKQVIAECASAKQEIVRELWAKYKKTGNAKLLPEIWNIHRDFVKVLRPDLIFQQNNTQIIDNKILNITFEMPREFNGDASVRKIEGGSTDVDSKPAISIPVFEPPVEVAQVIAEKK